MRWPDQKIFLLLFILLFLSIPISSHADTFSDMAFGRQVTVQVQTTDRYGRIVGEVILPDGLSLNKELVFVGLAWWYRKYAPNDKTLKALEAGARADKRGLWAGKDPIPPWEWRRGKRERRRRKGQFSK